MLPIPQDVIDWVNQLGKADGQPSILTFSDCQGNPVKDLQASVDSEAPTEIPGVQVTPPLATEQTELGTSEQPTIDMQDPKNLAELVPAIENEDPTLTATPDGMQTEDSIKFEANTATTDPEPEDPALNPVVQPDTGNDLDSDEEIQQPCCSG